VSQDQRTAWPTFFIGHLTGPAALLWRWGFVGNSEGNREALAGDRAGRGHRGPVTAAATDAPAQDTCLVNGRGVRSSSPATP
jgi:hypothetical protein